jgi:hypothetical protein
MNENSKLIFFDLLISNGAKTSKSQFDVFDAFVNDCLVNSGPGTTKEDKLFLLQFIDLINIIRGLRRL